ncbi:MAG: hypothetical protein ABWX69_00545, partial [Arthrobacter sp.]
DHPDCDGGLFGVDRVQQRVGFLVPALQPYGPAELGFQLSPFVGVLAACGQRGPEPRLRRLRIIEVPEVVQGLLLQHSACSQSSPAASSCALLM